MTVYTEVFGGNTLYPAEPTFLSLTYSTDQTLVWPIEQAVGGDDIVAKIIELHPTTTGLSVTLPDATLISTGFTAQFYNAEASTTTIKDDGGNTLLTVASGESWTMYLRDNSTSNGTWRSYQAGAGTSSANAGALAGSGLTAISTTLNTNMPPNARSSNYVIVNSDRANPQVWTGGSGAFTLPDPATVGAGWYVPLANQGGGSVTVTPAAGTIDASSNLVLANGESAFVVSDGTNYFTVGFGQAVNSVFDFISINVAGTGDYTLAGAELNRVSYEFTGLLTGNRNIIVPAAVQQYWVDNSTTGAFTLTVKTSGGTGVTVGQNTRAILYCDGTDVVNAADASSISFPILATQGGTGLSSYTQGDMLYSSASNTLAALAKSASASRYLANTGSSNNPQWDQVNLTNGVTGVLPAANYQTSGSFTATLTGVSGTVQQTLNWKKIGGFVFLSYDGTLSGNFIGTSTSNALTITGLPVAIQPSASVRGMTCGVGINNSFLRQLVECEIGVSTPSVLDINLWTGSIFSQAGFAIGNSKGIGGGFLVVYPLAP